MTLREKVQQRLADQEGTSLVDPDRGPMTHAGTGHYTEDPDIPGDLPELDETGLPDYGPGAVPIHVAMNRIMRDIREIRKADEFRSTRAGNYNYRGVDRIVNVVGPLLRRHSVLMLPSVVDIDYRDIQRSEGGRSHECTVTMQYRFVGPKGDHLDIVVAGLALDTSDKSAGKAQSVAWRIGMVQAFAIPTQDLDPDAVRIERGDAPRPSVKDYVEEICNPDTTPRRLLQIKSELATHQMSHTLGTNEVGDEETLVQMVNRHGKERSGG